MSSSKLYSEVEVSSEVLTASAHRQVQMLMEKCLREIKEAKTAIKDANIQKKNKSITNAADIVNYLRVCLNFQDQHTKALAEQLDSLYAFMTKNFLQATLYQDQTYLDQAQTVLQNIKEGWDGIASEST